MEVDLYSLPGGSSKTTLVHVRLQREKHQDGCRVAAMYQ